MVLVGSAGDTHNVQNAATPAATMASAMSWDIVAAPLMPVGAEATTGALALVVVAAATEDVSDTTEMVLLAEVELR